MYYSSFFVRFFMKHNLEKNLQIILIIFYSSVQFLYFILSM